LENLLIGVGGRGFKLRERSKAREIVKNKIDLENKKN